MSVWELQNPITIISDNLKFYFKQDFVKSYKSLVSTTFEHLCGIWPIATLG